MQNKAVEFHLGAALEYDSTFEWYLERSEVAASRFIVEVEHALVAIGENPDRWPLGRRGARRPDYWKERL